MDQKQTEEIQSLKEQLECVNQRCDIAWENWDLEAYEGAVETGNRLQKRLDKLTQRP